MPSLTTWVPFCAIVLPMWTMLSPTQQTAPELSGTFRPLPPEPINTRRNSPEPSETFRDLPEPTFRNLPPEPTPAYTGTLRNLPELASGTYTILHRNSPEPSGTLHFTPELSGTFRNPPPEPAPAHAGTLRNLPEPSSGTCSCGPHLHTPELIWAEDPISLRCWGKNQNLVGKKKKLDFNFNRPRLGFRFCGTSF